MAASLGLVLGLCVRDSVAVWLAKQATSDPPVSDTVSDDRLRRYPMHIPIAIRSSIIGVYPLAVTVADMLLSPDVNFWPPHGPDVLARNF